MIAMPSLRPAPVLLALSLFAPVTALAQTSYPSPYPTSPFAYAAQPLSDADLLAAQVRALAIDPLDVSALVRAGELALKLGDTTAAAAFFVRAERIDARNPRIKAGEGSLLVAAERPGEALRRFADAEALGGDQRMFAADRGLAYDLIGEPERAQRDYRLALRAGANDETQRRYALSLGISGKRELALQQIEPLLRRSDRGAWRARAFILAMGGDQSGAERIATSMMPVGLAQGLQPFFAILPTLPAADRAFAVHFGEVRSTPERALDRRIVPPLAALGPDPTAPVAVAAVIRSSPVREERRSRRRRGREELAALTTPPPVPLPQPPPYRPGAAPLPTQALPSRVAPVQPAPVQLAAASLPPRPSQTAAVIVPTRTVAAPMPAIVPQATGMRAPLVIANPSAPAARPSIIRLDPVAPVAQPTVMTRPVAGPVLPASSGFVEVVPVPTALTRTTVAEPVQPSPSRPATAAVIAQVAPVPSGAAPPAPVPVRSEDSILSSILADLVVPASELDAEPVQTAFVPPVRIVKPKPVAGDLASADKTLADKKIAEKKAADKKLADKKAADKKLADAKAAAEARKNDLKLLEPSRIWVQVAGGATEGDLTKAWAAARAKAPVAFRGRSGWTTPLRATNRVLAGPFKSSEEAQSFVNAVAKDGVSGFVFTSAAGQKIDKLPVR